MANLYVDEEEALSKKIQSQKDHVFQKSALRLVR